MRKDNGNSLREHQCIATEALCRLKDICDERQISFYLLAGSTLGAVRHKGMIPWDDDIDVGFLYEDWHKIRKILPQELKETKFVYVDDDINNMFPRPFGKILYEGRNCVDIFLIAKWTSKPMSARIHWIIKNASVELYKISVNYKKVFLPCHSVKYRIWYYFKHSILKAAYFILKIAFDKTDYIKLARWNEKRFEKKRTDCYINLYSRYKMEKEKIKAEWIDQPSEVEFEGNIYQTVGDPDAYLRHMYGNYMKFPPENERVVGHSEKFSI
ncbi:MAG: LicD family protein [Lachnospiraceae bacterium]|nr:LicD family protein [Lachnospiraceae bacterium]